MYEPWNYKKDVDGPTLRGAFSLVQFLFLTGLFSVILTGVFIVVVGPFLHSGSVLWALPIVGVAGWLAVKVS